MQARVQRMSEWVQLACEVRRVSAKRAACTLEVDSGELSKKMLLQTADACA